MKNNENSFRLKWYNRSNFQKNSHYHFHLRLPYKTHSSSQNLYDAQCYNIVLSSFLATTTTSFNGLYSEIMISNLFWLVLIYYLFDTTEISMKVNSKEDKYQQKTLTDMLSTSICWLWCFCEWICEQEFCIGSTKKTNKKENCEKNSWKLFMIRPLCFFFQSVWHVNTKIFFSVQHDTQEWIGLAFYFESM